MFTHEFPDTVFLPDRAELAINSLLGCLNSEKRQLPFCLTDLTGSPPRMAHTQFDYSDHTARVIDGLLLARAMTGTNKGDNQLTELKEQFFAGFDEDGLHYTPEKTVEFSACQHALSKVGHKRATVAYPGRRFGAGSKAPGWLDPGIDGYIHQARGLCLLSNR